MATNDEALAKPPEPKACSWPGGCEAPRKRFPGGQWSNLCSAHHSARSQANKRKPTIDPATGRAVTVGELAALNWHRKQQAAKAEEES